MLPSTAVSLAQTKPYRNSLQVWTFLTQMQVTFFPELPLRLPGSSFQHGLSRAFGSFSTQQRPMAASLSTPATTLPAPVTLRPAWTRPKLRPTGPVPLSVHGPAASASAGDLAPAPECPGVGAPGPAPRAPLHVLPHTTGGVPATCRPSWPPPSRPRCPCSPPSLNTSQHRVTSERAASLGPPNSLRLSCSEPANGPCATSHIACPLGLPYENPKLSPI